MSTGKIRSQWFPKDESMASRAREMMSRAESAMAAMEKIIETRKEIEA